MGDRVPDYVPAPVPNKLEDLPRYLEDELYRIKDTYRVPFLNYTILHDTTLLVPLTDTPVFGRLFDDPPLDNELDLPPEQFDDTTGVWTCVDTGIYDISCTLGATAPGAGNKQWTLVLQTTVAGIVRESISGNLDNFDLSVSAGYIFPLNVGETVFWDAGAVTSTPGGSTTDIDAYAQIWRVN